MICYCLGNFDRRYSEKARSASAQKNARSFGNRNFKEDKGYYIVKA